MNGKRIALLVAGFGSLLLVATVYAGGWAVTTVRDFPEYAIAGKPLQLTFMVRQHGVTPYEGLTPMLTAKSGSETAKAPAGKTKTAGEYTAALVLPHPGQWIIRIEGVVIDPTLPVLTVIAPGSPRPSPLSQVTLAERLFVTKGCLGCHMNEEVEPNRRGGIGPDLTGKRFPEAYLKSFLANPQAALGRTAESDYGDMPNLGLTKSEIETLTAFINRDRP